jgi:diketogulonate reductase-like aldo/keto reductase
VIDEQPTRELPDGVSMPVLGLGVWQIPDGRETEQAVEWALEAGYRHVDTAALYKNERSVGSALRRSGLPREQVFVTTKLMPARVDVARELELSLERLGLDYVDQYLIHWPMPLVVSRQWRALESLQEAGLARSIGVSNFGRRRLRRLVGRAERRPAVDQVQLSPFHWRRAIVDSCHEQGIVPVAYSPLERGKELAHPAVAAVAERLGRTPAQVMLRWGVQHGAVVIPKSSRREHIVSNSRIFDFELDAEAMATLDRLDRTRGTGRARP